MKHRTVRQRNIDRNRAIAAYDAAHPEAAEIHRAKMAEAEKLKKAYWFVLVDGVFAPSPLDIPTAEDYRNRFRSFLMDAYCVFNETHKRYPRILRAIRLNNPEWVDAFVSDHESKLIRCKVSIYPLD